MIKRKVGWLGQLFHFDSKINCEIPSNPCKFPENYSSIKMILSPVLGSWTTCAVLHCFSFFFGFLFSFFCLDKKAKTLLHSQTGS